MATLHILRGYSGSGKSTRAKAWVAEDPSNRVRSNRDDLRASLFTGEGVLPYEQEQFITRIQRETVKSALTEGKDVVLDDTNLNIKFVNDWVTFVHNLGMQWDVWDHIVDVDICIMRDLIRKVDGQRWVGEKVIRSQAKRSPLPWPTPIVKVSQKAVLGPVEPYVETPGLPEVVIFDLDGTLAKNNGTRGWFEWLRVGEDTPHAHVVQLLSDLRDAGHTRAIFLSARDSICYTQTAEWIESHVGWYSNDALFMRAQGDNRSDDIVKYELFNQHIRGKYNVRYVVDDRLRVRRLWYAMGLPLLSIGNPDDNF